MHQSKPRLNRFPRRRFVAALFGGLFGVPILRNRASALLSDPDAEIDLYAEYVRTSRDFKRVKQDKAWLEKAFPGWLYMPWTYQWTIGYTADSGKWSREHGLNGAFLDGNGEVPDSPPGKLAWINKNSLRFYMDHTAAKGYLHLWDDDQDRPHRAELHGTGVRTVPVNATLLRKLCGIISSNISQVKSSPFRAAYALDDEVSWGLFVHPTMWQVTDDAAAYASWLSEVYGSKAPSRNRWISYEELRKRLPEWTVRDFDASPLMDQWSFNDSYWCNFVGDLVDHANTVDPDTPCGIVGAQAPNAFGGYDYAKLMRKLQYIEAYNIGSSQAIIRSFSPHNAIPAVTSHFHKSTQDDIWQVWYYLAHGNRGHIGWVESWFDGEKAKPWLDAAAPHYLEAGAKIGPLLLGSEWKHDGVALYYSHPSIQLGWILDAEAHGATWVNRESDNRIGASHLVRQAWENMLRDSGLQFEFLSYVDLLQTGIPHDVRVLILPACLCLSDAEAKLIAAFCKAGGTVIADYLPGVWDQHGRGRANGGALDDLFDVRHNPAMTSADLFGGKLWCEVDQDANYGWKTYQEFLTNQNTCIKDPSGFYKAVRDMPTVNVKRFGAGTAILMNLSPQWYNAYRAAGFEAAKRREHFMRHVTSGGPKRWVEIEGAGADPFGYEITYFTKPNGRTVLFVCWNPEISGSQLGGGNAVGLNSGESTITLRFDKIIKNARDERSGKAVEDGDRFTFVWRRNEAVVMSFE